MLFNSFDFLIFFAFVFAAQAVLPHRSRNLFLLLASYFFYACWDWRFLSLVWISTLSAHWCSHVIHRSSSPRRRLAALWLSCGTSLAILGFFKYAGFFVDSASDLLHASGFESGRWHLDLVLPVGISFYTFQTISYVVDVYRRELSPLDRLVDFALYVAFFPQLVAGPIERGKNLAPQMTRKPRVSLDDLYLGSWLVLKGVFKKAVIADNMAPIVDGVFSQGSANGAEVLVAVYAFAFQIYGDFSGYSDIARGVARTMGYRLMLNFRLPYFATNPSDFWQRWHISLSSWLRDYLYIPLGGNRSGWAKTCRNLMITMVLGGLWHGAAWTFVLWGAFHGALLVAYRLAARATQHVVPAGRALGSVGWVVQVLFMFHLTCIGWLIFRAESLEQMTAFLAATVQPWNVTETITQSIWQIAVLCLPLVGIQLLEEMSGNTNVVLRFSWLPRTCAYAYAILAIVCLGNFGGREFIYFQF